MFQFLATKSYQIKNFVFTPVMTIFLLLFSYNVVGQNLQDKTNRMNQSSQYRELTAKLNKGWNTWDTRNVLSQVHMPESFAVTLELNVGKDKIFGSKLGANERNKYEITPGEHSYDGSYTELIIKYKDMKIRVQTAAMDKNLMMLVSCDNPIDSATLTVIPEMKWRKQGIIVRKGNTIHANVAGEKWVISATGDPLPSSEPANLSKLSFKLGGKIGISTNLKNNVSEIEKFIGNAETGRRWSY